jgi:acyl-CoA thioesterase YciA
MELISTHICKASEIGIHSNMFGGNILAMIDEAAASYSAQICDTPRIVTVKIDELVFKQPVKVGNILKIYGEIKDFGRTSITLYIEVRKHNVYTGVQTVVTHTHMKFVRIDDEGNPLAISERVKSRYVDRVKEFGRGLLTPEEIATSRQSNENSGYPF